MDSVSWQHSMCNTNHSVCIPSPQPDRVGKDVHMRNTTRTQYSVRNPSTLFWTQHLALYCDVECLSELISQHCVPRKKELMGFVHSLFTGPPTCKTMIQNFVDTFKNDPLNVIIRSINMFILNIFERNEVYYSVTLNVWKWHIGQICVDDNKRKLKINTEFVIQFNSP